MTPIINPDEGVVVPCRVDVRNPVRAHILSMQNVDERTKKSPNFFVLL